MLGVVPTYVPQPELPPGFESLDLATVPKRKGSGYPPPFDAPCAERIRQRIAAQPLLLQPRSEKEERVEFKVSIGVATIHGGFDSLEKLLQRAETALQQASSAGGNRVQVSEADATP